MSGPPGPSSALHFVPPPRTDPGLSKEDDGDASHGHGLEAGTIMGIDGDGGGPAPSMLGPISQYTPLGTMAAAIPATLFPAPIANLITAVATSTHLSLHIAAFLIEIILETSQYSTRLSLGYTRRILTTAISSARRVYLMGNAALEGDILGLISGGNDGQEGIDGGGTDAFLQVLNKYTNLGVYLIHHTFTMAELFAMSGFFLTANAVSSVHYAAQESVALIDSLFGSNESSRTLSAIITMVRKEVLEDERCADKGKMQSLAGLTKAMTAFACLQAATWKRTSERMKMKVLYDCTVLAQHEESFASSSTTNQPLSMASQVEDQGLALPGPGPSTIEARKPHHPPLLDEANRRLFAHSQSATFPHSAAPRPSSTRANSSETWDMDQLEDLVGESGDEIYDGPPDEVAREQHRQRRRRESTFEITDEITQSTTVTRTLERRLGDGSGWRTMPTLGSAAAGAQGRHAVPDVAVEDMGDAEIRGGQPPDTPSRAEEVDWIEVDQVLDADEMSIDGPGAIIPSAPNGHSITTASYGDALEHSPQSHDRIQFVIRTMTNKLLHRKRTVRHVTRDDVSEAGSEETVMAGAAAGASGAASPARTKGESSDPTRKDVRAIEWRAEGSSSVTPPSDASPEQKRRFFSRSPAPPSAYSSPKKVSRPSSMDNVMAKTQAAFRPLTRSRGGSTTSTPAQSASVSPIASPPPTPRQPVRSLAATVEDHPEAGEGVRAPPPTPRKRQSEPLPSQPRVPPNTPLRPAASLPHAMTSTSAASPHPRSTGLSRGPSLATVREAVHTSSSKIEAASQSTMPEKGDETPGSLFPHEGLVRNIHRFMRYSSAAYGQNFLRILGLGSSEFKFPSTGKHHANSWAFAQHTNIPIECLLLSSFSESSATLMQQEAPPLVHYVAVDHSLKAITLTCRGTLGLSDVLVDLTCEYQSVTIDGGDPSAAYYVHAGMWQSARKLTVKSSTVHQTIVDALKEYPSYGLVLAGHSLGGGVAALLAILCSMPAKAFLEGNAAAERPAAHPPISTPFVTSPASGLPPGRPIHCYAYGPPAVASHDLASYARGLITSVVQDVDLVPTLSLGGMKDFKNVALTLSEEGGVAEEIVGRVVGVYKGRFAGGAGVPQDEDALGDWMVSLIKTMRADMDNDKLYPPGMVYIMEHFDVFVTADPQESKERKVVHKQAHRVILRQCDSVEERFREPLFAKSMLQNHMPSAYERSTQLLYEGLGQGKL